MSLVGSQPVDICCIMYFSNSNPHNDDRELGAGAVEYALLVGLIASAAFAAVVGVSIVGNTMSASMITASNALEEEASSTRTIAPVTPGRNVDTGQAGRVRFENVGDQVRSEDLRPAKGSTVEITKDNSRRATVVITTPESDESVIVDDWIDLRDSSRRRSVTGRRSSPSLIGSTAPIPLPAHNRTSAHVISGA